MWETGPQFRTKDENMGKRPPHVKPPAHWTRSAPVPTPDPLGSAPHTPWPNERDPTRYGDWELKGIAVDF